MSQRREYEIAFVGLKPGTHLYEYRVDDRFFAPYGEQDFTDCDATVRLALDKNNGFMQLKFDVGGSVQAICDRCGNSLPLQLWDEFNIIVKIVDDPDAANEQEEDPDVYYIGRGESHLHLADWIYEFVNLSLPLQKMCRENEKGESTCNQEVLEKLKKMKPRETKDADTVWKGLDKFKNLE